MSADRPVAMIAKLRDRAAKTGKPTRFVVAGGVNTLFGFALYPVLLWSSGWLHEHYLVGLGISQAVCLVFAFTLYKLTVFRTEANLFNELWKFTSFYLVNYALNWAALPFIVEVIGLPPIVGQLGFTIVLVIGSYFWHSRVTFRPRDPR